MFKTKNKDFYKKYTGYYSGEDPDTCYGAAFERFLDVYNESQVLFNKNEFQAYIKEVVESYIIDFSNINYENLCQRVDDLRALIHKDFVFCIADAHSIASNNDCHSLDTFATTSILPALYGYFKIAAYLHIIDFDFLMTHYKTLFFPKEAETLNNSSLKLLRLTLNDFDECISSSERELLSNAILRDNTIDATREYKKYVLGVSHKRKEV